MNHDVWVIGHVTLDRIATRDGMTERAGGTSTYFSLALARLGGDVAVLTRMAAEDGESLLAEDGDEGVRLFTEHAADIRLVLLDMTMPGKSGEEVYELIRAQSGTVPIVLSSGHSEQDAREHFAGKELAGYLQKPYGVKVFGELLRTILG